MATPVLRKKLQREAYQLIYLQLAGVVLLSLVGCIFKSHDTGFGLLLGGLAYSLPNLLFVKVVFRFSAARQMTQFVAAFLVGELCKLFLSGIGVVFIVKLLPVSLLSVLVGFIGAIISFWIAAMKYFIFTKQSPSSSQPGPTATLKRAVN